MKMLKQMALGAVLMNSQWLIVAMEEVSLIPKEGPQVSSDSMSSAAQKAIDGLAYIKMTNASLEAHIVRKGEIKNNKQASQEEKQAALKRVRAKEKELNDEREGIYNDLMKNNAFIAHPHETYQGIKSSDLKKQLEVAAHKKIEQAQSLGGKKVQEGLETIEQINTKIENVVVEKSRTKNLKLDAAEQQKKLAELRDREAELTQGRAALYKELMTNPFLASSKELMYNEFSNRDWKKKIHAAAHKKIGHAEEIELKRAAE